MLYEQAIEQLAARMGKSLDDTRTFAEREIEKAVREALAGHRYFLHLLPNELVREAQRRHSDRVAAGEGSPAVRSFTHTGAPA